VYTPALHEQVVAAGAQGVNVGDERLNTDCPGVAPTGVSAAGCIVAPYGCTANFIFTDGASKYVGTARHCVDSVGQEVVMQVDNTATATASPSRRASPRAGSPPTGTTTASGGPAPAPPATPGAPC